MSSRLRLIASIGLPALFLAGCNGPCEKLGSINAPALKSGNASYSTYVAMGTSISAGVQSGGLVDRHQVHAFPALFAVQTGHTVQIDGRGSFTQPTIDKDGVPPLLQIVRLAPPPVIISNSGRITGNPTYFTNPAVGYHDMGIPGALLIDAADSTNYYATVPPINRTVFTFFNIITRHHGTVLEQVASFNPTFISFEYGANEALGSATTGGLIAPFPSAAFGPLLTGTLNGVAAACPNAKLAIFNVPSVTSIPFVTTFPAFTVNLSNGAPIPLLKDSSGVTVPMLLGERVLLTAGPVIATGTGIPVGGYNYVNPSAPGNGNPLANQYVLTLSEIAAIQSAITGYNTSIASEAAARGAAVVDLKGLLDEAASTGLEFQGSVYTSAFITGGLFSLDGIHPNDLGHGFLCNAMIDAVNAKFGSTIPPVDLNAVASLSSSRMLPALHDGPVYPVIEGQMERLQELFPWRRMALP